MASEKEGKGPAPTKVASLAPAPSHAVAPAPIDPIRLALAEVRDAREARNVALRAYQSASSRVKEAEHKANGLIEPLMGPVTLNAGPVPT